MVEELLNHSQEKEYGTGFRQPVPYSLYRRCRFCSVYRLPLYLWLCLIGPGIDAAEFVDIGVAQVCLLYTSDAADD